MTVDLKLNITKRLPKRAKLTMLKEKREACYICFCMKVRSRIVQCMLGNVILAWNASSSQAGCFFHLCIRLLLTENP